MIKKIIFLYSINFYSIENNQFKKNKTNLDYEISSVNEKAEGTDNYSIKEEHGSVINKFKGGKGIHFFQKILSSAQKESIESLSLLFITQLISSRILNRLKFSKSPEIIEVFNNIIEIIKYLQDIKEQFIHLKHNITNKFVKEKNLKNEISQFYSIYYKNKYKFDDEKFILNNINNIINNLSKINLEEYNIIISKIKEKIEASGEIQYKKRISNFLNLELMEEKFKNIKLKLENMDENYEKIATCKKKMKINEVLKITEEDTLNTLVNARVEIINTFNNLWQ